MVERTTVTTYDAAPVPRGTTQQDRISEWAVIILTLVALVLGMLVRAGVEGRTRQLQAANANVTLNYPADWQPDLRDASAGVTRMRDQNAFGYPTAFEFRTTTVDVSAPVTQSLALVANVLTLTRGRELSGFKVLDIAANQTVKGQPATKIRYVFVHSPGNAFRETVPVVVLGDDYLVHKGNAVYVFSLQSTDDNRPTASDQFENFVNSTQLP